MAPHRYGSNSTKSGGYNSPAKRGAGYRRYNDDPGCFIIDGAAAREKFPRPPGLLSPDVVYSDAPARDGNTSPKKGESSTPGEVDKSAARSFLWNTLDAVLMKPNEVATNFPIPLASICTPFSDGADSGSLPISDPGEEDPLRCPRCRCYANPFFKWSQRDQHKLQCNMCTHHMEVPKAYLEDLDRAGNTADEERHPELSCGSVDYLAPEHLDLDRPAGPSSPAVVFLLEASADSIASGVYSSSLMAIEQMLGDPDSLLRRRVCFITFDDCVQLFAPTRSGRFRRIAIRCMDDPFVPVSAHSLFVDVGDDDWRADLQDLLLLLQQDEPECQSSSPGGSPPASPSRGSRSQSPSASPSRSQSRSHPGGTASRCNVAGNALRVAVDILTQVGGGDVQLMLATSPSAGLGAPVLPVMPEKSTVPQNAPFFSETLSTCLKGGIAVNVVTAPSFGVQMDLETLQWLSWRTGGDTLHLPSFTPESHGYRMLEHLRHWAGKMQGSAYSCVVKIRCSKGLTCGGLLAPWPAATGSTDGSAFELPRISADTSFIFDIKPELEAESEEDYYYNRREPAKRFHYVQLAVLYTNVRGERMLRLHTTSISIVANVRSVFASASIGPLMTYLVKKAASAALDPKLSAKVAPKDAMLEFVLATCAMYQRHCYNAEIGSKSIVITKRLNLLPLYVLGARKLFYSIMGTGDTGNEFFRKLMRMPVHSILAALYPRIYPVDIPEQLSDGESVMEGSSRSPLKIPVEKRAPSSPSSSSSLPAPLAPMHDSVTKMAWPAYMITNGFGAWMYRSPNGPFAHIETQAEAERVKAAADGVCNQVREALEPSPMYLPMTEITNLSTAAEEPREQKIFIATLFIEDEGFTEHSYPDWIQFLQSQLQRQMKESD